MHCISLFFLFFFFLASCSKAKELRWYYESDTNVSSSYRSARLYYPTDIPFDGLEIEILKGKDDRVIYFNVLQRLIPPYNSDTSKAIVTIQDGSEQQNFIVQRLQGGQRLKLSLEAANLLTEKLLKGEDIHIFLDSYEAKISSEHFSKLYRKLK